MKFGKLALGLVGLAMLLASCEVIPTGVASWKVSGEFAATGTSSYATYVAAFYNPSGANTLVSNLGATTGGTFTITIDTSAITASEGDDITLYVIEDVDASGTWTAADYETVLESQSSGSTNTCPVFGSSLFASFEYFASADSGTFGHDQGWNVDKILDTETVVSGDISGALLTNWISF